ncbi:aromatic ring-hydroxylating oxygenase subunit alpha [Henriciella litoralis]|uniref:aromatic ring-hydroxylating oxygenase subunit alpha n=1 Tax=Henriciella litoralis TaxID=568102 RepID=UPI000A0219E4|nr:aromatic ring-hydroxylating dioxygenase subunit alpha [Henriciella litoralis]
MSADGTHQVDAELGTERIDPERYTSKEALKAELEHVFGRAWLMACPLAYLRSPGDAYPIQIGQEPIVIVHSDDGEIRAFYNVCRHRGRQIVTRPRNIKSLFCWFHGFEWNLNGSVKNIPDREDFGNYTNDEDLVLPSIQCEIWGGFAWINMDPEAPPLKEFLGEVLPEFERYKLEEYDLVEETIVEWDCNWKIGADAFQEGYHGPITHPQLQFVLEDSPDMQIDLFELHNRGIYIMGAPCKRLSDDERREANPILRAIAESEGVNPDDYVGKLDEMRLAIQEARRANLSARGCDVSKLTDDQMTDDHHYFIFPNITVNTFADKFSVFRYMPDPLDPAKMVFWVQQFERRGPNEEPAPLPEITYGKGREFKFDNEVYNQDANNVPWVQQGVYSKSFKGMLFNHQERRLRHFYHVLDQYLDGRR